VDQRLSYVAGQRLERLTRNETPAVARAMTAYFRHQAQVTTGVLNGVPYVHIFNPGILSVSVRRDDWKKIVPYLKDGTLDTTITPESRPVVLKPSIQADASVIDDTDALYVRTLTLLNSLFTVEFPVEP
jgi:hypothetical protein